MLFLILSILFSSSIFIVFKLFNTYNIHTLQAIVVNYFVALTIGLLSYKNEVIFFEIPNKTWFVGAVCLSILFISVFNIMAITAQKNGVTVAAVAGKMSVIIPVFFGVLVYHEKLSSWQITGVVLALIAVYLTTAKGEKKLSINHFLFPFLLFLGSGIIDTTIKYVQTNYVKNSELPLFTATIFGFSSIIGLIMLWFNKPKLQLKNVIAGLFLGIINYYSVYYLLHALATKAIFSGAIFTINNVSIVMLTTLLGVLLFKEKLNTKNWIGICFAIISIFLILK